MTPEELRILKDEKADCLSRLKATQQALHKVQIELDRYKEEYHKLDRLIAEETKLTVLEPTGVDKPAVKKVFGLTKKQALALIDEIDDEDLEMEEDEDEDI